MGDSMTECGDSRFKEQRAKSKVGSRSKEQCVFLGCILVGKGYSLSALGQDDVHGSMSKVSSMMFDYIYL